MELDDIIEEDPRRKTIIAIGALALTVVVLAFVTFFFFSNDEPQYEDDLPPSSFAPPPPSAPNEVSEEPPLEGTPPQIAQGEGARVEGTPPPPPPENARAETALPQSAPASAPKAESAPSPARNTITGLKYTIKPLNTNIAVCENMRNGMWSMPQACAKNLVDSIENLISTNKEIIALEISGIVDSSPYAGPSAELKQEGLASFRAREAIIVITRNFSNVAAFEGPSKQIPNKRGFEVRAYYLQN